MKAVILSKVDSPLLIKDVELTPLKAGQVLVKVLTSGLCGAQLHEIRGHKGNAKFMPHLLGHEGCGIVEETGPGVTTVSVGDKVVMHWRQGEGIESAFPSYILDGKTISSGKCTTLSEYSITSENRVTTVPDDTPEPLCALLGCGLTTALGIINNEIDLKFGESLAVVGCGGVGLNLIQGAVMAAAHPVIAIDINENKREKCFNMKANHFINPLRKNIKEELKNITSNGKLDIVIDTTGNPQVINEMFGMLSNNGRLIMAGQPAPGAPLTLDNANSIFDGRGKIIKASQGGKTDPSVDIPRYVNLHKAGILDIDKVVSHTFNLEQINEAFDLLRTGNAGRIMIKIQGENK